MLLTTAAYTPRLLYVPTLMAAAAAVSVDPDSVIVDSASPSTVKIIVPVTDAGLAVPAIVGQLCAHSGEPTTTQAPLRFLYHVVIVLVTATIA